MAPSNRPREGFGPWLYWSAWGLCVAGGALTLFGVWFLKTGYTSSDWPRVEGEVIGVQVQVWESVAEAVDQPEPKPYYYPEIEYRYEVDGQTYTSTRYGLGETAQKYEDRGDAELAAAKYQIGDPIEVAYDPAAPDQAVLRTGASIGAWAPLLLGVLFGGLGWFLSRFAERGGSNEKLRTRPAGSAG